MQFLYGEREVRIVRENTYCFDTPRVHRALQRCHGDPDKAVEWLIEDMALDQAKDASLDDTQSAAASPEHAADASAVLHSQANAISAASDSSALSPAHRSPAANGQAAPQFAPSGGTSASASAALANGESAIATETHVSELQEEALNAAEREGIVTSDGAAALREAHSSSAPSSADRIDRPQSALSSYSAASPATLASASNVGYAESGGRASATSAQSSPGQRARWRNDNSHGHGSAEIDAKGKRGADKRPAKNKLCPCGSQRKYKNCCKAKDDRKRAVAEGAEQHGKHSSEESSKRAAAAAVHLKTLDI